MAVIELAEAKVAYRLDGTGPGLVLVHGTGGNAETNWDLVVGRLARRWTVVRPNYSGSGDTTDDGGPLTVGKLAAQVVAAAEAAGAVPFDLVGFSLGAAVAIKIAAGYPDKVRSLVLLAGFAGSGDSRLTLQFRLWRRLIERDRDALARLILLTGFSPAFLSSLDDEAVEKSVADIVAGNNWPGMARQVDLDLTLDVRADAARIIRATLVIGCTHDHMVPSAHAKDLAVLIPGAIYASLDSGHLAPIETPSRLLDLLEPFLLGEAAT
ncbi:alpha/beta hydrolase [Telmatospirillum sp.]|uniref:alpha/beta fold hydrolase n=1 Tax=Telmatospirillum sp. TaxID=2079197 RepID=UPI00283BDA9F|nr:alpha/beta hydrolase [Telmatospirillum sp.]MDR3436763.1 alpha/beta hydrolase [Telmatospirillum sp.]